jgi:hypothetical protein
VCPCHNMGRPYGFHQKGRQTIVMPEAGQLVFLSLCRHAKGCSLLASRRNFIALVFLVYVTRPVVVVTAAVYDEQSIYSFMSPWKCLDATVSHDDLPAALLALPTAPFHGKRSHCHGNTRNLYTGGCAPRPQRFSHRAVLVTSSWR